MRVAYDGVEQLIELMPDLSPEDLAITDFGEYRESAFMNDMARVTEFRADPDLVETLATRSFKTLKWMTTKGCSVPSDLRPPGVQGQQSIKFWGGLTIEASGGGPGLIEALFNAAEAAGIEVRYQARAISLLTSSSGQVEGVRIRQGGRAIDVFASAVVLACGGFQANTEWRTRYLGPGWDLAKVRGTRFNTGDGIRMALDAGAMPFGNWSGCHASRLGSQCSRIRDLAVGDGFQKHSYHSGSWSMPKAAGLSMRAPTSATTPMPAMAR